MTLLSQPVHRIRTSSLQYVALFGIALAHVHSLAQLPVGDPGTGPAAAYARLPLSFEANRGQAGPGVRYVSHVGRTALLLTGDSAILLLPPRASCPARAASPAPCPQSVPEPLRMAFAGRGRGSRPAGVAGEDELPGKVNYFLGSDPGKWRTNLPTYAQVRYRGVYPGIDLVYYGNQTRLEFDFQVAPQADPSQIRLHFGRETHLAIDAAGNLQMATAHAAATLRKPAIYQQLSGKRQPVPGSFQLLARHTVGFTVGSYNRSQPLIIDPILVYSTYLGGSGRVVSIYIEDYYSYGNGDQGNGIAVDSSGNAYVAGSAGSLDFPLTGDPYQSQNKSAGGLNYGNGQIESYSATVAFVSKFNPAGTALLYSTYLGGSILDSAQALAIDSAGNAYLAGYTSSYDFPTTAGALQTQNTSGLSMAFVAKLSAAGNALLYSTLLGGANGNAASAIAIDTAGNAYVTGSTTSKDFPVTPSAFQPKFLGQTYTAGNYVFHVTTTSPDAFVAKLNASGSALLYSTYLGGSGLLYFSSTEYGDQGNAIAIDSSGNAYVTGLAMSKDFPVTKGALQAVNHGFANAQPNAFVTKVNPTGSALVYSTYLGGSGNPVFNFQFQGDFGNGIALDGSGDAYIAGKTYSADFPTTAGVVGPSGDPNGTGFVAQLTPDGSALVYSTYLGGAGTAATALAIDAAGDAYVTGNASSVDFPESPDALPNPRPVVATQPITKAFVAKLNATATGIAYATLLGGTGRYQYYNQWAGDGGNALALDEAGHVFVTGGATSSDFPVTHGAFQPQNNSASPGTGDDYTSLTNAFVSELALGDQTASHVASQATTTALPAIANSGQTVTFTATVTGAPGSDAPTGSVTFAELPSGLALSPPIALGSGGQAAWSSSSLAPGLYQVFASYSGDATHLSSTASGQTTSFRVVGPPKILTLINEPYYCGIYGGQCDFEVQVTDSASYPLAGVTVRFSGSGLGFSAPTAITNSQGQASVTVTSLAIGSLVATASVAGVTQTVAFPIHAAPAPLTVTLHPLVRPYGAANPTVLVSYIGLVGSDQLSVTQQTTATPASAVGVYPLTGTVGGAAASNYIITVRNTTLTVKKAPLTIVAGNVAVTYGQTPPPITEYALTGFVNGDTASVVTGAPTLSTSVTAATPVGSYPIQTGAGTLSATNYSFVPDTRGGVVRVGKAPLQAKANNLSMPKGGPIPTLTYTVTGFVNGDTAASSVSGAPVLSTSATTHSNPGNYPIYLSLGTLKSANYSITPANGVMTILP